MNNIIKIVYQLMLSSSIHILYLEVDPQVFVVVLLVRKYYWIRRKSSKKTLESDVVLINVLFGIEFLYIAIADTR